MIMKVLKQLFEIENAQIAVYEPTVDLIKRILYPRFEQIFADAGLVYKLNKAEGIITVPNVGTIIFRSMENPDRIIGYEVHHSHCDELDTLEADKAKEIWQKVLGRNRKKIVLTSKAHPSAVKYNSASVYTTPEGYRFTYQRWKKEDRPNYELIEASTYDNPFLDKDYVTNLKESYPEELIEAYLNGKFVNLTQGTVYPNFDPQRNRAFATIQSDYKPLHIGMDFNVNHMSAVVAYFEYGKLLVLDEITDVRDTPAMIAEIEDRYATGRKIVIYPDASGRSSKSVDASKSDISLLREAGFFIKAPQKNPPVRNRIIAVNTAFKNALGQSRLLINTDKCVNLTSNLVEQAYDKAGNPSKLNNVDHLPDALGYLVHSKFGLDRPQSKVGRFRI